MSDVPLSCFLSGGLDSSILSMLAARDYAARGETLRTWSVDYRDNDKYFTKSNFQPNSDNEYIQLMVDALHTDHRNIVIEPDALCAALLPATDARDLPGMADVDSSLLLFCAEVKKGATVCLSGECADELFGGYPWYHREEILFEDTFPWSRSVDLRLSLLARAWCSTARNLCARTILTPAAVRKSCPRTAKRTRACARCSCSTWTGLWQPCSTARTA